MASLTANKLRELAHYDPETGIMTRRVDAHGGRWKAGQRIGSDDGRGYLRARIGGHKDYVHRFAWLYMTGGWPSRDIDHIDGNPANSSWANLRDVDMVQNQRNKKVQKNNASGLKGAFRAGKRWTSRIHVDGVNIVLGRFDTPEDAHEMYCEAAAEHFGEHARFF